MDTTARIIWVGSLILAAIFGACVVAMYLQRRFDREIEELEAHYEAEERHGITEELTAILDEGAGVQAPARHHDTEPIRTAPPTLSEIAEGRTQHGFIPDLSTEDPPGFFEDDSPTLIRLTRTTVTESVELPADHLTTDCDDAILEIRRRFDLIRANIGSELELVGA